MTSAKLREDSPLWAFRAFLYNELRVTELYSGDGFTYRPDGTRGLREYIGIAGGRRLDEIGPHVTIDLER